VDEVPVALPDSVRGNMSGDIIDLLVANVSNPGIGLTEESPLRACGSQRYND